MVGVMLAMQIMTVRLQPFSLAQPLLGHATWQGRPDGSLREITALSLAAQALRQIRDRNGLDTALVDDVILSCVMPVGEQGSDIARVAALDADVEREL